jgi:diguanylate cyclase (GGDEF)-like protein
MFSPAYISVCIYGMLQLGFFILMENRRRNVRLGQERYFLWMLTLTLFSFLADVLSSLYKGPAWFFPIAVAFIYIEIILNTILLPIFFRYICEQIFDLDPVLERRMNVAIWAMTGVCIAAVLSNVITGHIFYFTEGQNYHRGSLFLVPMSIMFFMMVVIEAFIISQKQRIEASYYLTMALFLVPAVIGWGLQTFIWGLPFSLLGLTFAAQVVFNNIQERNIDKDYLTGAFNRQTLDRYLQRKIDQATHSRTFSAILLDIDNFKSINDHFGHYAGDNALIDTVHILRDSVPRTDLIARYGGDEFCVVLDSDTLSDVEATVRQISCRVADFNDHGHPYKLSFSMGYAVYQSSIGNKAEAFYQVIDRKMYEEKNLHRELSSV